MLQRILFVCAVGVLTIALAACGSQPAPRYVLHPIFGDRVFGRLGVGYSHRRWNDADVYWADDEDAFVEALRGWNSARSM